MVKYEQKELQFTVSFSRVVHKRIKIKIDKSRVSRPNGAKRSAIGGTYISIKIWKFRHQGIYQFLF